MGRLVAVQLPPTGLAAARAALFDRGDALAPIDPALSPTARAGLLAWLRPHALLDADGERDLPDPTDVDDDVALVVTTSGASGGAKAVELPAGALSASVTASLARLGAQAGWRWLCALPTHHVAGLAVLARAQACGTAAECHDAFDVDAVASALVRVDATAVVPTQLRRLVDAAVDFSGLAALLVGGAATDDDLLARARANGAPAVTTYGMTETCGGCVYDGRPLDGVEVDIDDEQRIWIAGPVLARRYRADPTATAEAFRDGWLRTSDRGRFTADGRVAVLGRADDVIVTGGENVAAGEVAAALEAVDGVVEAAVAGEADAEWGQAVVAWVVVESDGPEGAPGDAALRAAVVERLGAPAAPKAIRRLPALPRTALGKVDAARLPSRDLD